MDKHLGRRGRVHVLLLAPLLSAGVAAAQVAELIQAVSEYVQHFTHVSGSTKRILEGLDTLHDRFEVGDHDILGLRDHVEQLESAYDALGHELRGLDLGSLEGKLPVVSLGPPTCALRDENLTIYDDSIADLAAWAGELGKLDSVLADHEKRIDTAWQVLDVFEDLADQGIPVPLDSIFSWQYAARRLGSEISTQRSRIAGRKRDADGYRARFQGDRDELARSECERPDLDAALDSLDELAERQAQDTRNREFSAWESSAHTQEGWGDLGPDGLGAHQSSAEGAAPEADGDDQRPGCPTRLSDAVVASMPTEELRAEAQRTTLASLEERARAAGKTLAYSASLIEQQISSYEGNLRELGDYIRTYSAGSYANDPEAKAQVARAGEMVKVVEAGLRVNRAALDMINCSLGRGSGSSGPGPRGGGGAAREVCSLTYRYAVVPRGETRIVYQTKVVRGGQHGPSREGVEKARLEGMDYYRQCRGDLWQRSDYSTESAWKTYLQVQHRRCQENVDALGAAPISCSRQ